ncbi:MAG: ATP-binding protein [Nitrospinota bacterium]
MKDSFLEAVIREMQVGVVVLDIKKRILYSNPFFEKTFSINETLEGRKFNEIISDPPLLETIEGIISAGEKRPQEVTIQGKGNQILEARLVPFSDMIIGFFQDVTEEKRVEAIKRDFVANVSHELRTPLASIKGYAETLLDGAMDDKSMLKKFLTIIDRHTNRMTAIIDDLLTISMIESHQMQLKLEAVDIKGLINSVLQGFEKNARDKGLKLILNMRNDLPPVTADRVRLEQVIVNLVDNAIKYTNQGEVKIIARKEDNAMRIDVEDTGIGIPEKDIPRIFERFYRVDKGRSRELGGTGLGLAIVKHIIQAHKGLIWIKSISGKGTTFSLSLPLSI